MEPHEPVQPEEILLRRVPEAHMGDGQSPWPLAMAFAPRSNGDEDGLSVYRKIFHTPQHAADFRTKSTSKSWVAELRAADVFALGLTVEPLPLGPTSELPSQPGHAVLRELNSTNRKTKRAEECKQQLLAAVIAVTGPYDPPALRREGPAPSA